jgi:hypothetical protein
MTQKKLEEITAFLRKCDAAVRHNEGLNFFQKVDLDAERRRIAGRIQAIKGGSLIGGPSSPFDKVAPKKGHLLPPPKPTDGAPWKRDRPDAYRRPGASPLMAKNFSSNPRAKWDAASVHHPKSPKDSRAGRPSRIGTGTDVKEKSECSRSQFQLSVLKSEKYSIDTRTKKSVAQHVYQPKNSLNVSRGGYPKPQFTHPTPATSARPQPSDHMEDQVKLTVFKNTLYSNGASQQSRKPF